MGEIYKQEARKSLALRKQPTATHKSGSGMGATLKTHILKGKLTLCGLTPDFDTNRWFKNRYQFSPTSDCRKCAARQKVSKKAGA